MSVVSPRVSHTDNPPHATVTTVLQVVEGVFVPCKGAFVVVCRAFFEQLQCYGVYVARICGVISQHHVATGHEAVYKRHLDDADIQLRVVDGFTDLADVYCNTCTQ